MIDKGMHARRARQVGVSQYPQAGGYFGDRLGGAPQGRRIVTEQAGQQRESDPGLGETAHADEGIAACANIPLLHGAAEPVADRCGREIVGETDPASGRNICRRPRKQFRQRVKTKLDIAEPPADEIAFGLPCRPNRDVCVAAVEIQDTVGHQQVDDDMRVPLAEAREMRAEHREDEGIGGGNSHLAFEPEFAPRDLPLHVEQRILDLARGIDHLLGFRGQYIAGIPAIEYAAVEILLETVDAAQHRGPVDVELARGSRDRPLVGDHQHVTQVVPVDMLHNCSTIAQK